MFDMQNFHFFSLLISFIVMVAPLPLSAIAQDRINVLSEAEKQSITDNHDDNYVYLGKEASDLFRVIASINNLDDNDNSILNELYKHIENGFFIGQYDAVVDALEYAETVLYRNHKQLSHERAAQLFNDFDTTVYKVLNGELKVNPKLLEKNKSALQNNQSTRACGACDVCTFTIKQDLKVDGKTTLRKHLRTKQGAHIDGKVKVGKKATFKDKVTFKKGVCIEGPLSVGDATIDSLSVTDLHVLSCIDNVCVNNLSSVDAVIDNLTLNGTLSVNDLTLQSLSVTDLHVLSCVDNLCINSLSAVDAVIDNLTFNGTLSVNDLTLQSLSVTDLHVLSCVDSLCVHSLSAVDAVIDNLTFNGTLSVNDLTLQSLSVTDLHVLSCVDSLCVNSLSVVDESVSGTLSVNDAVINGNISIPAFTPAGVIHNDVSGLLSSSLIVNADVDAAAAIVDTKLATISTAGKVANSATTATSVNSTNTLVLRDGTGNFTANIITLIGTVTNPTDAATKAYVDSVVSSSTTGANVGTGTGLIFRDKTGNNINFKSLIQSSHIAITNNANDITLATDGTNLNTVSTLVARDASGNFSAGTVSITDLVASGNVELDNSTATIGNILKGGNSFIHNFGTDNTFVGVNAGNFSTSGTGQNSGLGINTLASLTTGSNNIAIGYQAGQTLSSGSGNVYINAAAGATNENNTIRIGTSQTACFIAGIDGVGVSGNGVVVDANGQLGITLSSKRFKHTIHDMDAHSANILNLRPVTFIYNNDATQELQFGLIAEEADQAFPAIVSKDEHGMPYTVRYHLLPVLLLNELQKQQKIIDKQQDTIDELKKLYITIQEMNDVIKRLNQEIKDHIALTIA